MAQEVERRARRARVTGLAPALYAPADVVDEWQLDELLFDERLPPAARAQPGHVARRPPLIDQLRRAATDAVLPPGLSTSAGVTHPLG
ncbi:MAG: hypothetical protein H0V12_10000 [Chloroflexi bacterium]|nr:hypothetical protein [Chloroflexota bacterium]